ncbi:MBOAT family protein [Candidatus Woesearchaeota archaeon]|nr:MBOAT family protein [Candidatus Woesearchaeota archaeon]
MEIVSLTFVFFFAIISVVFFLIPGRSRMLFLVAASLVFFIGSGLSILAISVFANFAAAFLVERLNGRERNFAFWFFVLLNAACLLMFKLISGNLISRFGLLLPLGLSFYTLTQVGYLADVHMGKIKAERDFLCYALYVSFFPKLIAGPIERAEGMFRQLRENVGFDGPRISSGLKLMLFGFFKKVVVVGLFSRLVDPVYNNVWAHSGPDFLIATFIYAFQIYYDFSAYSDIAVGGARVFGINLIQNFRLPYFSSSISEFWRRWHISLSSWIRDYLYIPLGGSRGSAARRVLNTLFVFMVVGLWHGITLTFVIWGLMHGLFASISGIAKQVRVPHLVAIPGTFILVSGAWVFFRANSLNEALLIYSSLLTGWVGVSEVLVQVNSTFGLAEIAIVGSLILVIEFIHYSAESNKVLLFSIPRPVTWPVYAAMIWAVLIFLMSGLSSGGNFIYARF